MDLDASRSGAPAVQGALRAGRQLRLLPPLPPGLEKRSQRLPLCPRRVTFNVAFTAVVAGNFHVAPLGNVELPPPLIVKFGHCFRPENIFGLSPRPFSLRRLLNRFQKNLYFREKRWAEITRSSGPHLGTNRARLTPNWQRYRVKDR